MLFDLFGKSKTTETLNAIEMLKEDHARVNELFAVFKELEDSDSPEIVDVVTTACLELMVHSKLEQEIFYPAVHKVADKKMSDLLAEAEIEHGTIDSLIEKLATQRLDMELYKANFKVVQEYVEHHVKEEENEMFPKIESLDLNLETLGKKMQSRQMELVEEIAGDPNIATVLTGSPGAPAPKGQQTGVDVGRFEGPI